MIDENRLEIVKVIRSIELLMEAWESQEQLGILDAKSAAKEREVLKQKEYMLKERMVNEYHLKKNGTPRSISYHEATDNNPKSYWITKMDRDNKIKAATREALIDKLYEYYSVSQYGASFESVFRAALLEKAITENPKQSTLDRNVADFKRYITPELAKTDITRITETDIKRYAK